MSEEILEALAEKARQVESEQREGWDERWPALAAGELEPPEVEELARLARRSPAAAAHQAAFAPLGEAFQDRLVARLRDEAPAGPAPVPFPTAERAVSRRAAPSPTRPSHLRWWLPAAALLAASLVLWLRPGPAPLPAYELALQGSVQEQRGGGAPSLDATHVLAPGNRLRLLLTPATDVSAEVTAEVFLWRDGRAHRLAGLEVEVAPSGAVAIGGTVGENLPLPPGAASLLVVLSRPGAAPDPAEAARLAAPGGSGGTARWRAWLVPVRVERGP